MADQLERAFRESEARGNVAGVTTLLDRVESRLNDEIPSPLALPSRGRSWNALPGPAVAAAAAAAVLIIVIGSVWLFGGFGSSEIAPIEEPGEPATTTSIVTTTVAPATTVPAQALEAPWVEAGEIRIGSTVITKRTFSVEDGQAVLEYDLTTLAPAGTAWVQDDGGDPTPAVLPEHWEIATDDAVYQGSSSPVGRSVRFDVGDDVVLDDVTAIRLVSWRTIAPVTYDFTIAADEGTAILMPDGSAIAVSDVIEMETGIWISFDVTQPPDYWWAVECGDWAVGASCHEPVPGSDWTARQSDLDLQIGAEPGTPLTDIPMRYLRPMWLRTEGSVDLPLDPLDFADVSKLDFPSGYVQLTDDEAVAPTGITRYGDQFLVSLVSATRRDVRPGSFVPFMGGRWILETTAGERIESVGTTFNDRVDGAFSIIFPPIDAQPIWIGLAENWRPVTASGVVDVGPVDAVVGSLDTAPIDVTLDDGSIVRVERFDIVGVGGYGMWSVPGNGAVPVIADVVGAIVDGEGRVAARTSTWALPPRHFGLTNMGRLFWFDANVFLLEEDVDERLADGSFHLEVRVDAEVPDMVPANVVVDLVGVAPRD